MKRSIITAIATAVLLLSGTVSAQHFYFFCINTTEKFNARWVVEQIEPILAGMEKGDKFTVYYTAGTDKSDVILEELVIDDYDFWQSKKEKLKLFEAEKIKCNANANIDNISSIFDKIYDFDRNGLQSPYTIDVYLFGDDAHYEELGESLILNVYMACAGNSTWNQLILRNNNSTPLKTNKVQELLHSKILKTDNIYIR